MSMSKKERAVVRLGLVDGALAATKVYYAYEGSIPADLMPVEAPLTTQAWA